MKKIAISLFVALVLVAVGWLTYSRLLDSSAPQSPQAAPSTSTTHAPSDVGDGQSSQVAKLEKSLNSSDGSMQLEAMTPERRKAYTAPGQDRFLPEGAVLEIKADSLEQNGGFASVEATITSSDGVSGEFVLLLSRQDTTSAWQVLDLKQK